MINTNFYKRPEFPESKLQKRERFVKRILKFTAKLFFLDVEILQLARNAFISLKNMLYVVYFDPI